VVSREHGFDMKFIFTFSRWPVHISDTKASAATLPPGGPPAQLLGACGAADATGAREGETRLRLLPPSHCCGNSIGVDLPRHAWLLQCVPATSRAIPSHPYSSSFSTLRRLSLLSHVTKNMASDLGLADILRPSFEGETQLQCQFCHPWGVGRRALVCEGT
jgi:hypothetical protein